MLLQALFHGKTKCLQNLERDAGISKWVICKGKRTTKICDALKIPVTFMYKVDILVSQIKIIYAVNFHNIHL